MKLYISLYIKNMVYIHLYTTSNRFHSNISSRINFKFKFNFGTILILYSSFQIKSNLFIIIKYIHFNYGF